MAIADFNRLSEQKAGSVLRQTNASSAWIEGMLAARPFESTRALLVRARSIWEGLSAADYLEAFEGHPMIGDISSLAEKYRNTESVAGDEQSGCKDADEAVLSELVELNRQYLDCNGFIFIVYASGKSALEMLAILRTRLGNETQMELDIAASEQLKITLNRLEERL